MYIYIYIYIYLCTYIHIYICIFIFQNSLNRHRIEFICFRVEFLLKTDSGYVFSLRVEFLLKTDSGYPRDAEVTLFTLANPEHSLRFNTHWSAPPVSALARYGGT